jgi:DNA-binding GntR family transcriptional regulator
MGDPSAPVQSRKAAAYRHIQSRIVSGDLEPGGSLSEVSLAKEIGISRTPVREAIGQLIAEGFLRQIRGRGTVVAQPTRADLVEFYELREALEVYAVAKVAGQPLAPEDSQRLDELCETFSAMEKELESSGELRLSPEAMDRFLTLDIQFHTLLLRAAGNHHILKVVRNTRVMIRTFRAQLPGHDLRQLRRITESHRRILDAIRKGDAAAAAAECGEHIRKSCAMRLAIYDHSERVARIPADDEFLIGVTQQE